MSGNIPIHTIKGAHTKSTATLAGLRFRGGPLERQPGFGDVLRIVILWRHYSETLVPMTHSKLTYMKLETIISFRRPRGLANSAPTLLYRA